MTLYMHSYLAHRLRDLGLDLKSPEIVQHDSCPDMWRVYEKPPAEVVEHSRRRVYGAWALKDRQHAQRIIDDAERP